MTFVTVREILVLRELPEVREVARERRDSLDAALTIARGKSRARVRTLPGQVLPRRQRRRERAIPAN